MQRKPQGRSSLAKVRTFLLDLDGTFYLGNQLFPWSERFIRTVTDLGKDYRFVTNNSSRHSRYYAAKISKLGIPATPEQIFTSGEATIYFLKKNGITSSVFLLGTPELEEEFGSAGFKLTDASPEAVVLGFDMTLNYDKLRTACALIREGIPFFATHPDLNCPTPEGPIPDCGAMIAAIKASTGLGPVIIGKPYPAMVEALCAKYGLAPEEVAMVGDRLYTDIAMGQNAGIATILVLSGETRLEDLDGSEFQPDFIARDLGEVADWLQF